MNQTQTPAAPHKTLHVGGLHGCPTLRLHVAGVRQDVTLTEALASGDFAGYRTPYYGGGACVVPRASLVAEGFLPA